MHRAEDRYAPILRPETLFPEGFVPGNVVPDCRWLRGVALQDVNATG